MPTYLNNKIITDSKDVHVDEIYKIDVKFPEHEDIEDRSFIAQITATSLENPNNASLPGSTYVQVKLISRSDGKKINRERHVAFNIVSENSNTYLTLLC